MRLHLVELEDQAWLPAVLRDGATAYLDFAGRVADPTRLFAPRVRAALEATGAKRIVDLGSGSGGPALALQRRLADAGWAVELRLSDRYPNSDAFALHAAGSTERVTYEHESVDALAVPERLSGLRTLLNAFHHFRPDAARAVLQDAVDRREPIAVLEVAGRRPDQLVGVLLGALSSFFILPFLRPFSLMRIALTWIVPAIPLLILWDGMVSCLRVYSPGELRALTEGLSGDPYVWEMGRESPLPVLPPTTYLVGRPR